MIGKALSHYRIVEKIGEGGMGEVYRARDTRLGRDVAVKVISPEVARDPERIKRFEQEARAAGALSHPNVCAIYDVGTHEGSPFVVMELLEGETLREKLASGPVPVRKALDYAAQAAHGLAAAHEKGIVHRDLKPANLFVTKDGRVKVLDFGLAKLTRPEGLAAHGESAPSVAATETGVRLGTVGYMSPEQVRGEPVDGRSDLFSLGAILYELLTGKRAFHGATYVETLHAILNAEPPPLPVADGARAVPPALELILRRCLEKTPEQRFQSARDLAFDLENVNGSAVGAPVVTTPGAVRARRRRLVGLVSGACSITAILATAGAYSYIQQKHLVDPARVKYTRLTVQRGTVWGARFSPDGRTVFYSAAWDGRPPEVYETRPGFPTSRTIVAGTSSLLSVSKSGTMAVTVLREPNSPQWFTLAEVPITGGTPRRIHDFVFAADWAPDGKTLAISRAGKPRCLIEMPPGRVLYQTTDVVGALRVSPDGRRLAVLEAPHRDMILAHVVIMDTTGHVTARTGEWNFLDGPCWSPDGREAWFTCSQDGASSELRALSPSGRQRVLARFDGNVALKDVGPSGQLLIARVNIRSGILGRSGRLGAVRELSWYDYSVGDALSADGRVLLFHEEGLFGGRAWAACLRGMDGSPPVRLGAGNAMSLSPDGKWAAVVQHGPPQRLVLLPTGAGDSTSLPPGDLDLYYSVSWMPDGKHLLFTAKGPGQQPRSYTQDLVGGLPTALTQADSAKFVARHPQGALNWSSDGRSLFIGRAEGLWGLGGRYGVWRLDPATGKRTPWLTSAIPDSAGVSTTQFVITPDGQSYAHTYTRNLGDLYLVEGLK